MANKSPGALYSEPQGFIYGKRSDSFLHHYYLGHTIGMSSLKLNLYKKLKFAATKHIGVKGKLALCLGSPEIVKRKHALLCSNNLYALWSVKRDPGPLLTALLEAVSYCNVDPLLLSWLKEWLFHKIYKNLEGRIVASYHIAAKR